MEEQNRLYDLLQSATQKQIDRIAVLTKEYQKETKSDPSGAKALLAEIAVLCSYIKRRKHLTLLTDRDYKVALSELERAFSESLLTLKLLHVRSTLYIEDGSGMLPGKTAAALFDFYEEIIETALAGLTSVQISLTYANALRLSMRVRCGTNLSAFAERPGVLYETEEEEGQQVIFQPEGGGSR